MTEPHATGAILDPAAILNFLDRGVRINSGIRAAADLREHRLSLSTPGPYVAQRFNDGNGIASQIHAGPDGAVWLYIGDQPQDGVDAGRLAAVLNADAATIRRWRGVAERHGDPRHVCVNDVIHGHWASVDEGQGGARFISEPCPDLIETLAEVRAYLTAG